ncbi:GNAT family N-acetyltransferase [Streptomyces sp. SID8366]|uniref:GNAT family N-acetyltransferase n=1 Tax=unclassified Streptomyces TaxID=2593676 RepID=UPI000DBA1431|nr:GNAT family N-acetyltransferase [Streptomyces sp. PsTaAH-130]MYU04578.1 GNAT family N-acetyltransferase [Streptomyces sp. SID8366]MYU62170.1 GNAT family N-acetyltransferase [Streptomyces sp. SID69]RAJ58467.1 FR47-like protein [Streptomyces sp. PsTaAH-130]
MHPESWQLTDDLDDFLARAGGFLRSRPAAHTVPLTVTDTLRRHGLHYYGRDAPLFGTLTAADGTVLAALTHTPPHGLYLTPVTPERAEALAGRLAVLGHRFTEVTAEEDTAAAFVAAWTRRTGREATVRRRQRLYRLGELTAPEPAPAGRPRVAGPADRALLVRWFGEFAEAMGETAGRDAGPWADARISYGGITLWEAADGTPLAMAGATQEIAGQVRVAPVYTPAALRGHGYAGAVTAEVSRAARAAGADEVLLFTDLANPTSNGLYQRLGYAGVADFTVWECGA